MNRLLWKLSSEYNISLSNLDGGNLRNAIPRESFATIVVDEQDHHSVISLVNEFENTLHDEFG